mgnify:CR=1 FL=1
MTRFFNARVETLTKPAIYQVRFSSYQNYQDTFAKVYKAAHTASGKRVTQKIIVLAGLLALKHASKSEIKGYLEELKLDKNPNKPEHANAMHRAVELTLHDTALAKSLLGHLAFDLRLHTIVMRQVYHLGTFKLAECDHDDLKALLLAAEAITADLNS